MPRPNTPTRLLVDLAKGFALSEFYPLTHPTLTQALQTLAATLLAAGEFLEVRLVPGGLVTVNGVHGPRSAHVDRFVRRLAGHGVSSIALRHDVGAESMGRFLSAAALPPRVAKAAGGLGAAIAAAGAARISVDGQWVQPVPVVVTASVASGNTVEGLDSGIALWSAHDMYEQVRESAVRVENENTGELRRLMRESATESERLAVLNRLEFLAQYCLSREMVDRGVELVQDLRKDAEELRGQNPAARGMVMLAMHRVANRSLIEELVARLGKARSEEERAGLRSTLLHVGADTVSPLVRSLVAATDVSARRAYRDALVALDQVGVPLLEDMVGDERWFVVRNMVGILGEIRSADAIEHFRRTIEHSDARVRRETILALAKIGGEEAVPLLARGLNDKEPSLRAAAALGMGLTKLGTAVTPLLARLGQETDLDTQVEVIRALGRVGDARAVPVLAERASAGGFFNRTPAAIRVEAVRALADVGGEPARAVLQRLLKDRSDQVREAVFGVLSRE